MKQGPGACRNAASGTFAMVTYPFIVCCGGIGGQRAVCDCLVYNQSKPAMHPRREIFGERIHVFKDEGFTEDTQDQLPRAPQNLAAVDTNNPKYICWYICSGRKKTVTILK